MVEQNERDYSPMEEPGTRLYPLSIDHVKITTIYFDKPMICYLLTIFALVGGRDILIIVSYPDDTSDSQTFP